MVAVEGRLINKANITQCSIGIDMNDNINITHMACLLNMPLSKVVWQG